MEILFVLTLVAGPAVLTFGFMSFMSSRLDHKD
jgi:hypothetical protein